MAKNVRSPDSCIREFINVKFKGAKQYTKEKCRWSLQRSKRILEAGGFDASPHKITSDGVEYIKKYYESRHNLDSYVKGEMSYLKRYLKYYKNNAFDELPLLNFSKDMRVNVHWLEEEQYQALM